MADRGPLSERQLGSYLIGPRLGAGGMGEVYRARDTRLKREVAIKVLSTSVVDDPERLARFRREAEVLAALNHQHITAIYDIAEQDGVHFIVMEHVAGRTLDECLGPGGLPVRLALKYASQVADALARAHVAGVVHRDIKPANIMITPEGMVKVLDFGVAKLTGQAEAPALGETVTAPPQTVEGTIVGSVAYMSPEQAQSQPVDARSDIFSFGAVLYEMLSGCRPFEGQAKDPISTLAAILHKEPPPLPEAVPDDLQKLVGRCLRKDPERRPQSMKDVKNALDELREDSESGRLAAAAQARGRVSFRRSPWFVTGAAVIAIGFVAWLVLLFSPDAPLAVPTPLTTFPGFEREATFSPDGTQIAFVWDGERQDNQDIYVQVIGSGRPLRLTHDPAADFSPAWSPDGRWIAFLRKSAGERALVFLMPALGGPERRLAEVLAPGWWMTGPYVAWAPDSRHLAIVDRAADSTAHGLFLLSTETGERRVLTTPPAATLSDSDPAFSPDGRHLAFARALGGSEIFVLNLTSDYRPAAEPRQLTFAEAGWAGSPAWVTRRRSPVFGTRRELVFGSLTRSGLWKVNAARGPVEPLALGSEELSRPAVSSAAARLVYTRSGTVASFARVDLASGQTRSLVGSSRQDANAQLSPDGRRVVFQSTRSGAYEIWTSNVDGLDAVQITSLEAPMTGAPSWSHDGTRIGFDSNKAGQFDIYVVAADGGTPQRVTTHPANDVGAAFSYDGRWIYFGSNRTGEWQIWKMPSAGGEPVQVTQKGGFWCRESPDGRYLYYLHGIAANTELRRVPADGGEEEIVVPAVLQRAFAPAREGVYFLAEAEVERSSMTEDDDKQSSPGTLSFLDLRTGQIRRITDVGKVGFGLAVSPDEREVLYSRILQDGSDLMLVENFR